MDSMTAVTKSGKLRKELLPAMYLDTNFVIDYWIADSLAADDWLSQALDSTEEAKSGSEWALRDTQSEVFQTVQGLVAKDKRVKKVLQIRNRLTASRPRITPVMTDLAVLELMKWNAESAFRQHVSDAVGARVARALNDKEVGNLIERVFTMRREEVKSEVAKLKREGKLGKPRNYVSTALEILVGDVWTNFSYAVSHGFEGLITADIVGFSLPFGRSWKEPGAYACLQLYAADIMHILFAQHLGCEYIVSFDSDFKRAEGIIREETGIEVLSKPEDVLRVI